MMMKEELRRKKKELMLQVVSKRRNYVHLLQSLTESNCTAVMWPASLVLCQHLCVDWNFIGEGTSLSIQASGPVNSKQFIIPEGRP